MKLKRHWIFLSVFAVFILVGIIAKSFDVGMKEAIAAVTWKKIIKAGIFSLIITWIFSRSSKEKK